MKHSNIQSDVSFADVVLTDEQRGYYLDAMEIQCWALQQAEETGTTEEDCDDETILPSLHGENEQPVTGDASRLQQQITACCACALGKGQHCRVFGMGNPTANLMLIVIAPKPLEPDQSGNQYPGSSKNSLLSAQSVQLLTKMLLAIKVNINDIFITSLLKCVIPPGHAVEAAEITACRHHLNRQIEVIQPDRLFVMGELVAQYLLDSNEKIDSLREQRYEYAGRPVGISYSADELLLQPENKRKAWLDLQRLRQQLLQP